MAFIQAASVISLLRKSARVGQQVVQRQMKSPTSARGRSGLGLVALAFFGAVASRSFVVAPVPEHQPSSRRGVLGALVALPVSLAAAPAFAAAGATLASKLEVSGIGGPRGKQLNGLWDIVEGKRINERAVYKKGDQELYLMFNNCEQFQISTKPSGECNGFAQENKGAWTIDGEKSSLKIKPVRSKEEQAQQPKPKAPKGPSLSFSLPGVPKLAEGSAEEDDSGFNVEEYLQSKGSKQGLGTGFSSSSGALASFFTMEEDEQKIADSLESKQ